MNRRDFLKVNAASVGALSAVTSVHDVMAAPMPTSGTPLLDVDTVALISRSDLRYVAPVEDGASGQPIGNGRMGTMVWTSPSKIRFHINRADVFYVSRNHAGVFEGATDICGVCGDVAIDVGGQPFAKSDRFQQHLSLHDAESTINGEGVQARCFVSAVSDVLVLEIDDQRPQPGPPLRFTVSLWGKPSEQIKDYLARFAFVTAGDRKGVSRTFTETGFYCSSVMMVEAVNNTVHAEEVTDTSQTFRVDRTGAGKTIILISSAATMDAKDDIVARASKLLTAAATQSYTALQRSHRAWWSSFWRRTFVSMSSPDGVADFMERIRVVHLYLMASTSRGKIAPKWNTMLFVHDADNRPFGAQYWGWTMEALYLPLFAAGASDLADPYFNMYVAQLPNARIAATQRWGAKGAHFPETNPFDGPVVLPDDVAQEYRAIMMGLPGRKPLSDRARALGWYDCGLFCFARDTNDPPIRYDQITHIMTTGPKIALHAWWRYRCMGDERWLRTHAYPLLRDCSEFYRTYATRRSDGRYHIEGTNVHESFTGANDGIMDLGAIRGIVPLAIRAAEILNVDADLRTQWREFLENLAPYPMGREPESKALGGVLGDDLWSTGHLGEGGGGSRGDEDLWLTPVFPFENYTLETTDKEMQRIVNKLVEVVPVGKGLLTGEGGLGTAMRTPIIVARVGRGTDLPIVLSAYYNAFGARLPNGFNTFEGGASSVEHLGVMSATVQDGLMQSISGVPGQPEVIRVFPAWPKTWDSAFALVARGGFRVSSTIKNGVIPFVEIKSTRGETCRIRNPWGTSCFLTENGKKKQQLSGDLLQFKTKAGKTYQLFPNDLPTPIRVVPAPAPKVAIALVDGPVIKKP